MKLVRIEMDGIRNLPPTRVDLAASGAHLVTGEAGAGKTAFLEAMLAAHCFFLPGALEPDPRAWRSQGSKDARVELEWQLEPLEQIVVPDKASRLVLTWRPGGESTDVIGRVRAMLAIQKMEYMDAGRASPALEPAAAPHARPRVKGARSCRSFPGKYDWVERELLARSEARAAALARKVEDGGIAIAERDTSLFARMLEKLCPSVRASSPVKRDGVRLAGFVRPSGEEIAYGELATHERMCVLAAIVAETSEIAGGLWVIDTPELGLHPSQQAYFLGVVAEVMGTGNILAATTSPALLRAAPRQSITLIGEAR
jgi:hypothetical protein